MMQAGQKRRISSTVLLVVLVLAAMLARLLIPYRYVSDRAPADAWYRAIQIGMPEEEWLPIIRESPDGEILHLADSSFNYAYADECYLVLFTFGNYRVRSVTACSREGVLLYSYGVRPIAFDNADPPRTLTEARRRYGDFHGERGTGAWCPLYVTDRGTLIEFHVYRDNDTVTVIRELPLDKKDLHVPDDATCIIYENEAWRDWWEQGYDTADGP